MDAVDLRNVFYAVASIALILFIIVVIAIFYLIIRIKKIADQASLKIDRMTAQIADESRNLAKTWGRISIARFVLRALRFFL